MNWGGRGSTWMGLALTMACGGGPAPGTATGVCVGGACNPGLMCDEMICVDETATATITDPSDSTDPTTSATSTSTTSTSATVTSLSTTVDVTTSPVTSTTDETSGTSDGTLISCEALPDGCTCDASGVPLPDPIPSCAVADFGRPAICCADAGWPVATTLCECRATACALTVDEQRCSCAAGVPDPGDTTVTEVGACSGTLLDSIGFTGVCCQYPDQGVCECNNAWLDCEPGAVLVADCSIEEVGCGPRQAVSECS